MYIDNYITKSFLRSLYTHGYNVRIHKDTRKNRKDTNIMHTTKKFALYVGLNDKDTKVQEISTLDAYRICSKAIGDCSIQELTGFYTHNDGQAVIEKTLKIEIFGETPDEIRKIADFIKLALNQESIIIEETIVSSEFI